MAGQFEIYKDGGGWYRFRLKGRNGKIVATGEPYPTKAGAKKGVKVSFPIALTPYGQRCRQRLPASGAGSRALHGLFVVRRTGLEIDDLAKGSRAVAVNPLARIGLLCPTDVVTDCRV
jgi:uncharacterized protein